MRLTGDFILRARVCINPLRERELDLRGYKIPAVENLGATKDGFDCLDMSDNEIKKLENFPRLKRLRMLLLHNNHISKIQPNLQDSLPSLRTLVLTGNKIANFEELESISSLRQLEVLSLTGNPICKRKYYREYVVYKCSKLRVLDSHKIKPKEREAVQIFFNSAIGRQALKDSCLEDVSIEASEEPGMESTTMDVDIPNTEAHQMDIDQDSEASEKPKLPEKNVDKLKVSELRDELRKRGLLTNGLKSDLVARLKQALLQ